MNTCVSEDKGCVSLSLQILINLIRFTINRDKILDKFT